VYVIEIKKGGAGNITFEAHIENMTDMLTDSFFWYGNHRYEYQQPL
jgi:hypothetical protein